MDLNTGNYLQNDSDFTLIGDPMLAFQYESFDEVEENIRITNEDQDRVGMQPPLNLKVVQLEIQYTANVVEEYNENSHWLYIK